MKKTVLLTAEQCIKFLLEAFKEIDRVPAKTESYIRKVVVLKKYKKNQKVLEIGQQCDFMGFLVSGVIAGYRYMGEKPFAAWIVKEKDFYTSPASFFMQQLSEEEVVTITDCWVLVIDYSQFAELLNGHHTFYKIAFHLIVRYYLRDLQLQAVRACKNTAEKLKLFWEKDPELMKKLPDKIKAAYLGITAEQVCRAKREDYLRKKRR